ncbi:MAG: ABC transporter permease [Gemmatimonadaceae bacterium]|nr:ABC transporter permease [Gemmatimonadaceae bacterium]
MSISARSSLTVGLEALRANPLRTLLSTLGVVMGVAAMVSVLSIGDGVEAFARGQIEKTTDLLGISVSSRTTANVDGQFVRRPDAIQFTRADAESLLAVVQGETKTAMTTMGAALVQLDSAAAPRGFGMLGVLSTHFAFAELPFLAGAPFADTDTAVVVLNSRAAGVVARDSLAPEQALGATVVFNGNAHRVVGVLKSTSDPRAQLTAFVPVDDAARSMTGMRAPNIIFAAPAIEEVDRMRKEAETWLASRYGEKWKERVEVETNQARVKQVATGMLVFKLLMGAITGVSLLVGGIGIMNVLLAAVAERTREIGIRKAMGARNRDILVQFLSESVTITSFGAAIGVALGLGIAFLTAWIMRVQTKAPVEAAVTPGTILVVAGLSVAIGLTFGLYPARRAAGLSPIDAIRHE